MRGPAWKERTLGQNPLGSPARRGRRFRALSMRLSLDRTAGPLRRSVHDGVEAGPLAGARRSATTAQLWVAAAMVPMVASTIWLALTSDHLARPAAAAAYWGWLVAGSMGDRPVLVGPPSGQQIRSAARDVRDRRMADLVAGARTGRLPSTSGSWPRRRRSWSRSTCFSPSRSAGSTLPPHAGSWLAWGSWSRGSSFRGYCSRPGSPVPAP